MDQTEDEWKSKKIILIRHGRSIWNDLVGAHKKEAKSKNRLPVDGGALGRMRSAKIDESDYSGRQARFTAQQSMATRSEDSEDSDDSNVVQTAPPQIKVSSPDVAEPVPRKGFRQSVKAMAGFGGSLPESEPAESSSGYPQRRGAVKAVTAIPSPIPSPRSGSPVHATIPGYSANASLDTIDLNEAKEKGGLFHGLTKGLKKAVNVISHADKLNMVDHSVSPVGMQQLRALHLSVAGLLMRPAHGGEATFLDCKHWYTSPYLRALQTAGYALSPLFQQDPTMKITVTPLANEIVNGAYSYDCFGKAGNVGICVPTRAVAKVALMINEESEKKNEDEEADLSTQMTRTQTVRCQTTLMIARQTELAAVSATLCAMDYREVSSQWWKDPKGYNLDMEVEDKRIRKLVGRMLRVKANVVGVVGHSLCFRRLVQLFWPKTAGVQEHVRMKMMTGSDEDTEKDPYEDKMMNCGTLVLTFRYKEVEQHQPAHDAEFIDAEFLFDTHMEQDGHGEESLDIECNDLPAMGYQLSTAHGVVEDDYDVYKPPEQPAGAYEQLDSFLGLPAQRR